MNRRFTVITLLTLAVIPGLIIGHFVPAATGNVPAGVKVLVEGAPIHGTNGIMFGPDGNLYIASALGKDIIVMNPESGEIIQRIDDGPQSPDDVAFGPDGSLYWTDIIQGNVGRMFPNGTIIKQFVAPGVNPITFSDDGRLFVALDFLGDALYELDPDLVDPPRLIATNLGMMNGMDWGPDGRLYGPIWTQGRIASVSVDGPLDMRTVADGFALVAAVKFDSQGRLHTVAREFSPDFVGQVIRVNASTGEKEVLANMEYGLDNLAFDSEDRLFISSANDGFIKEVLSGGDVRLVSPGGIIMPYGVAVLPGDHGGDLVYLADMWTIREFDGTTGTQMGQQFSSIGATDLIGPMYVAPDGENLIISSWFDGAVQVWNFEEAESVEEFLAPWPPNPWLPMAATRFQGDVVVSELATGSVVIASTGEAIASGLFVPMGLAAAGNDLFVTDWASGMVWQIVTDGAPSMAPVASGLAGPEGLAWDIDGSLLVVEGGAGRISAIDLGNGGVSVVVEGLNIGEPAMLGTPPAGTFNGLDVGTLGHIYVSGDVTNVIYRIGATQRITMAAQDLQDTAFRVPGSADRTKRNIRRLLNTGQRLIDKGKLRSARAILNVLRRRMDGSGRDWVTDAGAQQELLELLDALIAKLNQQIG